MALVGSQSRAEAINDRGQVVGWGGTVSGAFVWTRADGLIDPGTLGGTYSTATAVNDKGQVVGASTLIANVNPHAFLWSRADGMRDLGTLGGKTSWARNVNDNGQVVGESATLDGSTHAFSWTAAGGMVDLGTFGGPESYALAVNNKGQVVGWALDAALNAHAFSWTASGGMVDLGPGRATAVANTGQVVGTTYNFGFQDAFSWTADAGMVVIGGLFLGHGGSAQAVNEHGQVVGESFANVPGARSHAFSWTAAGGIVDLGTLGGEHSWATDVNNNGQVIGSSWTAAGSTHAFFWTPQTGLVDLGTLGGRESIAVDVNDYGQVVGGSHTDEEAYSHATLWSLPVDVATAIDALTGRVASYNLPHGLTNALTVKLHAALASWQQGHSGTAIRQLGAFMQQVEAKRHKALTDSQAQALIATAQTIVDAIQRG